MTLDTTTTKTTYTGNGVATNYAIGFDFLLSSDVVVYYMDDEGERELLNAGVHYNIVGSDVVFVTAPASGQDLVIVRSTDTRQLTDLVTYGPWNPDQVERMADRVAMVSQETAARVTDLEAVVAGMGSLPPAPGWFDVTDYGAAGDGTTDCRAAIQAAVDAACAAGGGTVYFPNGTYSVHDTVFVSGTLQNGSKIRLLGADRNNSIVKIDTNLNKNVFEIRYGSDYIIDELNVLGGWLRGDTKPTFCAIWRPGVRFRTLGTRVSAIARDGTNGINITTGGTGYTVGDVLTATSYGSPLSAIQLTVKTVAVGVITEITVTDCGRYTLGTHPTGVFSVTGGTGTGATFTPAAWEIIGEREAFSTPSVSAHVWELNTRMPDDVTTDEDGDGRLGGAELATYWTYLGAPNGTTILNRYQYDLDFQNHCCIYVSGPYGGSTVKRVTVQNCIIRQGTYACLMSGSGPSHTNDTEAGVEDMLISGNTFLDCGSTGVGGLNRIHARITNNSVKGFNSFAISSDNGGVGNIISENIISSDVESTLTYYHADTINLNAGGSGYIVGDELLVGGGSTPARVRVATVNGGGAILTFSVKTLGRFTSSTINGALVTAGYLQGAGSGATFTCASSTSETFDIYAGAAGISCYSSSGHLIQNNIISGVEVGCLLSPYNEKNGIIVNGNRFSDCGAVAVQCLDGENITINDNIIRNCYTGIDVYSVSNTAICTNAIYDCYGVRAFGIRARDAFGVTMVGNTVYSTSGPSIRGYGLRRSTLSSNVLSNPARWHIYSCIRFDEIVIGTSTKYCTDNVVIGNRGFDAAASTGLTYYGLFMSAGTIQNTVTGNDFTECKVAQVYDAGSENLIAQRTSGPTMYIAGGLQCAGGNIQTSGYVKIADGPIWKAANGSPNGAVPAVVGSLYSQLDASGTSAIWSKQTGTGATGWVLLT